MAGNGPPPKHPSVRARRNDPRKDFRSLPPEGRKGRTPPWPLHDDLETAAERDFARAVAKDLAEQLEDESDGRKRGRISRQLQAAKLKDARLTAQIKKSKISERALWRQLWRTPQAVMWEESHAFREVAQYVRWKIRAEQGDLKAATEARQLSDRLGLNPLALLRMRAEIQRVDAAEARGERRRNMPASPAAGGAEDPRGGLYAVK